MALLLLRNEADCLVPNMETESVSSHLPPELNRSPYRASGFVRWPIAPVQLRAAPEADIREDWTNSPTAAPAGLEAVGVSS